MDILPNMPAAIRRRLILVLALPLLVLLGCSSPTEKADAFYRKGMALFEKGGKEDLVQADLEFRNAIMIKRKFPEAIYGLALVAERQGKFPEMFSYLNQTLDLDPNHLQAQVKMAKMLLGAGQLDRAREISERTSNLHPEDPSVQVLQADIKQAGGDSAAALRLVQAVLSKNPDHLDALEFMATERIAAGQPEAAVEHAERGLRVDAGNIRLQLVKVQALDKLGKLDDAEAVLRGLIRQHPDNRTFQNSLIQFFLAHDRRDAAEAELRAVAARSPADVQARLEVVRFVQATKGTKAAIADLEASIRKEPNNYELKFALAGLHQGQNDRAAAEAVIRSVIAAAGDNRDGLKAKGILAGYLLAAGDKDRSMALVREILTKDARNEQALVLKANVALDEGKVDGAIADLRAVLQDVPDSSRALLLLARAHELQGAFELAEDHYVRAFQASRGDVNYGMAHAEFLMRRGQSARAEGMLNDLLKTRPGSVPLLKLLAQAKANRGDWEGARKITEQIPRGAA
ncbi:MAG: tetratricopeptide repeat protein [Hydrogenophilaceae bacterium]|nr:tetratricopeptide repeat protein [Hydrogenophilaceae bacterium]